MTGCKRGYDGRSGVSASPLELHCVTTGPDALTAETCAIIGTKVETLNEQLKTCSSDDLG